MMMNCMGSGIGSTMIMGWPLADWATLMLLLIASIIIVAFVSGILTYLKPRPEQARGRSDLDDIGPLRKEGPAK